MIYETIRRNGSCIGYLFHGPLLGILDLDIVMHWVQKEQIRKNNYWTHFSMRGYLSKITAALFLYST